jgi:hypothetical protein
MYCRIKVSIIIHVLGKGVFPCSVRSLSSGHMKITRTVPPELKLGNIRGYWKSLRNIDIAKKDSTARVFLTCSFFLLLLDL